MSDPIITLTTDFGPDSHYVATMKGVILDLDPRARLVDLSHAIPPQDLWHAAFFLANALPYFPSEAIHVVVVDPGVGTTRRLLYAELGRHRILAPDNGVLTMLEDRLQRAFHLRNQRFWRTPISSTFHGRDILAPAAAHLGLGVDPAELGPPVDQLVRLQLPTPVVTDHLIQGEVMFSDWFGNLITNIPARLLSQRTPQVTVRDGVPARWVGTYGEAMTGELVALTSSSELVEIAVVQGDAAKQLGVGRGCPVTLRF